MTNMKKLTYVTCILSMLISSPLWTMNLSQDLKEKLEDMLFDKQNLIEGLMPAKGTEMFNEMCIEAFIGSNSVVIAYMNTATQAIQAGASENHAIIQGLIAANSTQQAIMQNLDAGVKQVLNEAQNEEFNAFSQALFPHACDIMLAEYVANLIDNKDSDDDVSVIISK
jgi:hypothetical protein